jgi:cytochrome c
MTNRGLQLRRSLLLVGMVYAALFVTVSLAFDGGLSDLPVEPAPPGESRNPVEVLDAVRTCSGCHALSQVQSGVGPHLVDVVDRPAGAVSGYAYSDAMRRANIRWSRERLREFLIDPQAVVPGTAMPTAPVDEATADAIVNYLGRPR